MQAVALDMLARFVQNFDMPYLPNEETIMQQQGLKPPTEHHYTKANLRSLAAAGAALTGSNRLCQVGIAEMGPQTITYSLKCGSTGRELWARLPIFRLGRHFDSRTLAATMLYARECHGLPVPDVLAWNNCPHNSVGTPYIIMQRPSGVRLQDIDLAQRSEEEVLALYNDIARIHAHASRPAPFQGMGTLDFRSSTATSQGSHHTNINLADSKNYTTIPYRYSPSPPFHEAPLAMPRNYNPLNIPNFWKDAFLTEFLALYAYNESPQVLEEKMAERSLSPDIWVEHADGSRYIPGATELMELGSVAHFVASEWKLPKGFSPDVARNCLVLGPSVLSNVFVNPKTMRVAAITDLETAIVAPFTLSLTCPGEISQSAGAPESWVQTSGDFAEVPYEGVPAPDSSQYNNL
ncbi:hypothetical protein EIP86_011059 [Pleurotus ostreatoroseus]|nr:hypothetical protein EIP86_008903 [Pleurotus ostreatoroseus]KAF7799817.1 hypothetical protein EIP86_011059 [Pleurotus ostreatoroseus]